MYAIDWTPEALRRLLKLDRQVARGIERKVARLSEYPERAGKRLRVTNLWSLRVGKFRVLYVIDTRTRRVQIVTLGPRESVYSGL